MRKLRITESQHNRLINELFGWSKGEKAAKTRKELITLAADEIRGLTPDKVGYFYKSSDSTEKSVSMVIRHLIDLLPNFANASEGMFEQGQVGIEITPPAESESEHPLVKRHQEEQNTKTYVVPFKFQNILKYSGDGKPSLDIQSIKKGLMGDLMRGEEISGMDSGLSAVTPKLR